MKVHVKGYMRNGKRVKGYTTNRKGGKKKKKK